MYDLTIIGAGAAGIEAAKAASRNGLKTALIDRGISDFGGTCLNRGCIPAKYYLNASRHNANLSAIYNNKNRIIEEIKNPTLDYLNKNGIDIIWGRAHFIDKNTVEVDSKRIAAKNIIIATGSLPQEIIKIKKRQIIFAEDIFSFSQLPQSFLIVGAGCVGLEVATLLHNLGKKVLVIEKENQILPNFDNSLSRRLKLILEKKGVAIKLSDRISNYDFGEFDMVVLAAGRIPNLNGLNTEAIGLVQQENGWLKVNEYLETNVPGMYACGDIVGKKLLAYVAQEQARICIANISGNKRKEDFKGLAECVFTQPQLAFVGVLEEEAKIKGFKYNVIKSNFLKSSSAYVYSDTNGFIEILIDRDDKIIGAAIISNIASELIGIFSLAIRLETKINQLKKVNFIHPTISEIIGDILRN